MTENTHVPQHDRRWTAGRKLALLLDIKAGRTSLSEAGISIDEYHQMSVAYRLHGLGGLRSKAMEAARKGGAV